MRNSKVQTECDKCYLCGKRATDEHHLMQAPRRRMADKYRLVIYLCHGCHMRIHQSAVMGDACHRLAQRTFETEYGHEKWMEEFGKNYL